MRTIFIVLFILGIVVGYLLPGNLETLTMSSLKVGIFDVPKGLGQLEAQTEFFKYTVLAETETGSVELLRIDDELPTHMHTDENHFVYIYRGQAKGTIGDVTAEVGPGELVVIPAGTPHSVERIGDAPVEILLFSSPPFKKDDISFLETE